MLDYSAKIVKFAVTGLSQGWRPRVGDAVNLQVMKLVCRRRGLNGPEFSEVLVRPLEMKMRVEYEVTPGADLDNTRKADILERIVNEEKVASDAGIVVGGTIIGDVSPGEILQEYTNECGMAFFHEGTEVCVHYFPGKRDGYVRHKIFEKGEACLKMEEYNRYLSFLESIHTGGLCLEMMNYAVLSEPMEEGMKRIESVNDLTKYAVINKQGDGWGCLAGVVVNSMLMNGCDALII